MHKLCVCQWSHCTVHVHSCALMLNKNCSDSFHECSNNDFVYYMRSLIKMCVL